MTTILEGIIIILFVTTFGGSSVYILIDYAKFLHNKWLLTLAGVAALLTLLIDVYIVITHFTEGLN